MGKSGGGKMQAAGQKRAAENERRKAKSGAPDHHADALAREAERLRAELAQERRRVKMLEDANNRVTEKLDVAIESVKLILARQG
jgi:hypothetical protein